MPFPLFLSLLFLTRLPKYFFANILHSRTTGAANIADADKPPAAIRADQEVVPEEATRPSIDRESFHVGRGGAANVHLSAEDEQRKQQQHAASKVVDSPVTPGTTPSHQGLADKLKHKIFGIFKK